ncbi:Signal peptidase complex catalytic subunit S11C [Podochytrium sp. JEL0797]|nr:Signal peptidase complex catalytic subunit S11C [Podochytrium sp. JEL0797]
MFGSFQHMSVRQVLHQILNFFLVVSSALAMWKGMAVVTNSESPIVVVLSESMEPAMQRGDLLLLSMFDTPIRVGDITVFKIAGKDIPIVHRVLEVHDNATTGKHYLLTKGDNNPVDDRGLYNRQQMWVTEKEVVGRVTAYLPYIGMVTIILNDYPQLKVVLLGVMGIFVLITKEFSIRPDGWGHLLSNEYSRKMDVRIRGFSGYNSVHLSLAVGPILQEIRDPRRIKLVTVLIGTNDFTVPEAYVHVGVETYKTKLLEILETVSALAPVAKIVVMTPPPLGAKRGGNYWIENARIYRDACSEVVTGLVESRKWKHVALLNLWDAFLPGLPYDDEAFDPAVGAHLFSDGLHFSAEGNRVVFDAAMETVRVNWPEVHSSRVGFKYPNPEGLPMAKEGDVGRIKEGLFSNHA